ncbi:MAG: alpha/beta hydrolase, partial [Oscillospiraceae bacterium]
MAINPILKKALEAISYPDINVTDNYKLERKLINATHIHLLKGLYKTWDHIITVDNYNIPVRLYSPNEKTKGNDIIIFFHGGGWVTGNINSY